MNRTALVAAVVLLSACSHTVSYRTHPALLDYLVHINSIAVVAPEAEVILDKLGAPDIRLDAQELMIRSTLKRTAKRELVERGYALASFEYDTARRTDDELMKSLTEVREEFKKALKVFQLGRRVREADANVMRLSVGNAANVLAARSGADALIVIYSRGARPSLGWKTVETITNLALSPLFGLSSPGNDHRVGAAIALISGADGAILWANSPPISGDGMSQGDLLRTMPRKYAGTDG
jgi:hypothetical protein